MPHMPNAVILPYRHDKALSYGPGPTRYPLAELVNLASNVYHDDLERIIESGYSRAVPTAESFEEAIRTTFFETPTLRSRDTSEIAQLADDLAFDYLFNGITKQSLLCDTVEQITRSKELGGIIQPMGCGAFPNYFGASGQFPLRFVKSDREVVIWAARASEALKTKFEYSGSIDMNDKQYWGRPLFRCALAQEPKVRLVIDYPLPANIPCASVHLPLLHAIHTNLNGSFYGTDVLWSWREVISDLLPSNGVKQILSHDIRGQDRFTSHLRMYAFNKQIVELFDRVSLHGALGRKPVQLLNALESLPIFTPFGWAYYHRFQALQSGRIGVQTVESFLNLKLSFHAELIYCKKHSGLFGLRKLKVLADDGTEGGDWDSLNDFWWSKSASCKDIGL